MKIIPAAITDVLIIEPTVFSDGRCFFFESFNAEKFSAAVGREIIFVQDNESYSKKVVLRGLHYRVADPQGKLV